MVGKHILVSGRVQGVGFRYFVKAKADELGLKGWTRNKEDGRVEIEAYGPESAMESFLGQLKIGPSRAEVKELVVGDIEISKIKTHNEFRIRFDRED